jgi:hypothetical protein
MIYIFNMQFLIALRNGRYNIVLVTANSSMTWPNLKAMATKIYVGPSWAADPFMTPLTTGCGFD